MTAGVYLLQSWSERWYQPIRRQHKTRAHSFGLWEEGRVPGGNPQMGGNASSMDFNSCVANHRKCGQQQLRSLTLSVFAFANRDLALYFSFFSNGFFLTEWPFSLGLYKNYFAMGSDTVLIWCVFWFHFSDWHSHFAQNHSLDTQPVSFLWPEWVMDLLMLFDLHIACNASQSFLKLYIFTRLLIVKAAKTLECKSSKRSNLFRSDGIIL